MRLLVQQADLARVTTLLAAEWQASLAREGLAPVAVRGDATGEHAPCPACGTAAPLVNGACSDCGLQLA